LANLGNYPFLPLIRLSKQHAEPLISPEKRGSCLELTHNFKNSPVYVVFYTLNESKKVSNKEEEVKASKGVRVWAKEGINAHNK